jgi:hypothetical protein
MSDSRLKVDSCWKDYLDFKSASFEQSICMKDHRLPAYLMASASIIFVFSSGVPWLKLGLFYSSCNHIVSEWSEKGVFAFVSSGDWGKKDLDDWA